MKMNMQSSQYSLIEVALQEAVFPKTPENLYDPIRYMFSLNGKRVRPTLALMAAEMFGCDRLEEALPVSLAIEYFHNFSLLHDDIMDNAPLRRGKPTVFKKWNSSIAILSGDVLLVKAYQKLSECAAEKLPKLLEIFNTIAIDVCEGQQLDMDYEELEEISQEQYINMIRLKTSVLIGGALQLGGVIANATESNLKLIYDFGVQLGVAFQLQDDILDVYGDPSIFGKQIGGDIISNKKTILLVSLLEKVKEEDKADLKKMLLDVVIDDADKVSRVKDMYSQFNVLEAAVELKEHFTDLAMSSLDQVDVSVDAKSSLRNLVNELLDRRS